MWHEARRSERKVHDMMDAARKRAQRRALFLAKRRGDPQQSLQVVGSRCRMYRDDGLYQATQDQQGLIPWNGKQNILIDRFDGRSLLDFIRDSDSRHFRVQEKTEEEEELEEFVNFERYRDLIKHRRRGFTDEEGLQHVNQEMEAKSAAPFVSDRSHPAQPPSSKGSYSQVGFSYDGNGKEEAHLLESDDEEDDEDVDEDEDDGNSDDSNDEGIDTIAKEFGVKRYNWLVYMDKKAKEEEKRQKEVIRGDPAIRKLSRKERRKASQMEREREREAARITGTRVLHHDPYRETRRSPTYEAYSRSRRSRSRSRSHSPSYSRRHDRGVHSDSSHRSKPKAPKIEYITEFGGSTDSDPKLQGFSPPPSPPSQVDVLNRPSSGRILEALHVDPASAVSLDQEKITKVLKSSTSTSSALSKLSKPIAPGAALKTQQGEKKETPQERLKRIMNRQLNKQIKKDTAVEMAKKREQERQRLEKLAETSRVSRYRPRSGSRSQSRSPPRRYRRSRSRSRSRTPRRYYSRSRSRSHSHSRSSRSRSHSRSPRVRSRSRY
ncbi:PREDICTED: CLK4-associating serine/arginine rich protein isoform X2 [Nelumbo nucifera]|uniref:CLK4-associating serine/arginine rich protein isoform X2 n=1 Tax=Nelumbo nucifera TaxID=4432 RepID=A0A1U8AQ61_NELNU|nr:PREDICTED: CLK4-associating serine/arginine rich protein isoform X2 [Nelumbo nucifera]